MRNRRRPTGAGRFGGLAAVQGVWLPVEAAHAATVVFVVNSTADRADTAVNGACQTSMAGECTFARPRYRSERGDCLPRSRSVQHSRSRRQADQRCDATAVDRQRDRGHHHRRLLPARCGSQHRPAGRQCRPADRARRDRPQRDRRNRDPRCQQRPSWAGDPQVQTRRPNDRQARAVQHRHRQHLRAASQRDSRPDVCRRDRFAVHRHQQRRLAEPRRNAGQRQRNVISGCYEKGVTFYNQFTWKNYVQNNIIGLDPTGTLRRGVRSMGVDVNWSANGTSSAAPGIAGAQRHLRQCQLGRRDLPRHGHDQQPGHRQPDRHRPERHAGDARRQSTTRWESGSKATPTAAPCRCPPDSSKQTVTRQRDRQLRVGRDPGRQGAFDSTIASNRIGRPSTAPSLGTRRSGSPRRRGHAHHRRPWKHSNRQPPGYPDNACWRRTPLVISLTHPQQHDHPQLDQQLSGLGYRSLTPRVCQSKRRWQRQRATDHVDSPVLSFQSPSVVTHLCVVYRRVFCQQLACGRVRSGDDLPGHQCRGLHGARHVLPAAQRLAGKSHGDGNDPARKHVGVCRKHRPDRAFRS